MVKEKPTYHGYRMDLDQTYLVGQNLSNELNRQYLEHPIYDGETA